MTAPWNALVFVAVPLMLLAASGVMAVAWLAHLRFRHWRFRTAMLVSWTLVLPEYMLNVYSTRLGLDVFTGAQMASLHLAFGVVCVAVVASVVLDEPITRRQRLGFGLMVASVLLIMWR